MADALMLVQQLRECVIQERHDELSAILDGPIDRMAFRRALVPSIDQFHEFGIFLAELIEHRVPPSLLARICSISFLEDVFDEDHLSVIRGDVTRVIVNRFFKLNGGDLTQEDKDVIVVFLEGVPAMRDYMCRYFLPMAVLFVLSTVFSANGGGGRVRRLFLWLDRVFSEGPYTLTSPNDIFLPFNSEECSAWSSTYFKGRLVDMLCLAIAFRGALGINMTQKEVFDVFLRLRRRGLIFPVFREWRNRHMHEMMITHGTSPGLQSLYECFSHIGMLKHEDYVQTIVRYRSSRLLNVVNCVRKCGYVPIPRTVGVLPQDERVMRIHNDLYHVACFARASQCMVVIEVLLAMLSSRHRRCGFRSSLSLLSTDMIKMLGSFLLPRAHYGLGIFVE